MKTSMLMKIVAALAIGAAFPLGASAAQPAKTTTEHGAIQNVKAPEVKAPEVKAPEVKARRKHYFAQPWMDSGS
jgi:hypothetical protein